ncbi:MAG TPA: cysteine--tRNA ligase [Myxococcaceae bacterium]|nr:cysteine--tRNA ligase [Myxococcaceae bacterium]
MSRSSNPRATPVSVAHSPPVLSVYNTLTRRKEPLEPLRPGEVRLYVCGPTVYSWVHIGNARTFTIFDVVVRYLRHRGYRVSYVRNFTDVDDKIINAARETGEDPAALAERFVQAFEEDARGLGLLPPDVAPRVTQVIPEIRALIQTLLDQGIAYSAGGDVYFQVSRWPEYAKLSRRNLEDLRAGERVTPGEHKREPLDFALWKAEKPGEPAWDAPWGRGRPGWHIECSAMSEKYLGQTFDIHGGGLDLIFPHHENEIAQSEAAHHAPLARVWMHAGFLELENAKMSKSLGNVVRLRDALAKVDGEALRLFFLSSHYRNGLDFSDDALFVWEKRMEYFYETLQRVDERLGGREVKPGPLQGDPDAHLRAFEASMDDDFNTAGALAALSALFGEMNELLDHPAVADRATVVRTLATLRAVVPAMGGVLGVLGSPPAAWLERRRDRLVRQRGLDRERIEAMLAERAAARKAKDFARSDAIRDELLRIGVELRDGPTATRWKVRS